MVFKDIEGHPIRLAEDAKNLKPEERYVANGLNNRSRVPETCVYPLKIKIHANKRIS